MRAKPGIEEVLRHKMANGFPPSRLKLSLFNSRWGESPDGCGHDMGFSTIVFPIRICPNDIDMRKSPLQRMYKGSGKLSGLKLVYHVNDVNTLLCK